MKGRWFQASCGVIRCRVDRASSSIDVVLCIIQTAFRELPLHLMRPSHYLPRERPSWLFTNMKNGQIYLHWGPDLHSTSISYQKDYSLLNTFSAFSRQMSLLIDFLTTQLTTRKKHQNSIITPEANSRAYRTAMWYVFKAGGLAAGHDFNLVSIELCQARFKI